MPERKCDKILQVAFHRGFMWPSSEIHGGLAGFFDYGPMGALLKQNIENKWRELFIVREGMFEIETPTIMPEKVFRASGHLEHFSDPLVECAKCKGSFRADHVVKDKLKIDVDDITNKQLDEIIKKEKVGCPKCGGALGKVWSFNLMFETSTGAGKDQRTVHMRPETAQGMFVAFPRLFQIARKKLPFGACQIGHSFRNEISPRQGMIRLREFSQAEAEIFYNPKDKSHPKFSSIKNKKLPLYPSKNQGKKAGKIVEMTVGQAVKEGLIPSELQAYYVFISERFFEDIGVPRKAIRCREQLPDEKAHYSKATWDVEIYSEDYGWIEVAAIADRTGYDLGGHQKVSNERLSVSIDGERFVPNVMEASFGVDRPFYSVLEHSFKEAKNRTYFAFKPEIAPIKAYVFPLVSKDNLPKKARETFNLLIDNKILVKYDESGSIGKRYARADEIGVPYCITVDYDTLKDNTVTIRDRDSTKQKRVKIADLPSFLS